MRNMRNIFRLCDFVKIPRAGIDGDGGQCIKILPHGIADHRYTEVAGRGSHNRSAGLATPLSSLLSTWVMGIDHRATDILVPELLQHRSDVVVILK